MSQNLTRMKGDPGPAATADSGEIKIDIRCRAILSRRWYRNDA